MQLDDRLSLRKALAAATCGLLGIAPAVAHAQATDPLQVDSALLYYSEKDRVTVAEAVAAFTQPLGENQSLTVTPMIDTITGASPNGATMTDKTQTFGSNTTPANTLPLESFSDRRYAISIAWEQPLDRLTKTVLGANASTEQDYNSLGLSGSLARDFNNKLTTLSAGLSGNWDSVQPTNGIIPDSLAPLDTAFNKVTTGTLDSTFSEEDERSLRRPHTYTAASGTTTGTSSGSSSTISAPIQEFRSKQAVEAMVGMTQVVNRRTLMQLNYGIGMSSGYLTDPYKIISMIDHNTGETVDYRTEQRPDTRMRQTVYWKTVLHLPTDVVRVSYRYYWDDWGIRAHTAELQYHLQLGHRVYLLPEFRYYAQSAANFFHYSLIQNAPLPNYASADYRLATMSSYTYGLKMAMSIGKDGELSARATYMKQTGNNHPADAIGVQRNEDLYPGLEALVAEIGYTFKF